MSKKKHEAILIPIKEVIKFYIQSNFYNDVVVVINALHGNGSLAQSLKIELLELHPFKNMLAKNSTDVDFNKAFSKIVNLDDNYLVVNFGTIYSKQEVDKLIDKAKTFCNQFSTDLLCHIDVHYAGQLIYHT